MSLSVTHLTKEYGTQIAVNNISFSIPKGQIVGFLGPNGAGKSTTMKIITGYLAANKGEVRIDDISATDHPLAAKKKIGYLPEANPLYYEMYVREYLYFIAGLHHISDAKKKIEDVIKKVGLSPEAHKKAGQLSKGYKQRVGLAAALLHDPEVLILDEPTSGLDPNQLIEIRSVIKELAENKTVLFSTHIMQEVEAVCDRVIIINKGNIVADDTLENIRTKTSSTSVIVQFQEAVTRSVFENIQAETIVSLSPEPSQNWKIITHDPAITRKEILQISITHNLNINSLNNDIESLESIFKNLTSV